MNNNAPGENASSSPVRAVRVALYARVSTDDQADRGTAEAQKTFIRNFANLFEFEVVDEYIDDGVSGTVPLAERPAGRRLLRDARSGQFTVVLVYRLDRLARSLRALLDAHAELEQARVNIRSVSEPFDTSEPIGRFVFQLLGSMAELEKSTIIERMSLGRDRVARQGKWTGGHVPYGFDVTDDGLVVPSDRKVDPLGITEADLVRELFSRIADGSTIFAEARRLEDLGVPALRQYGKGKTKASSRWTPSRISYMLRNTAYKGTIILKSRHGSVTRDVPALVTEPLWDQARLQIKRNEKVRSRRGGDRVYLLRGLITCADCGSGYAGFPMHRMYKGKTKITYYYRCNAVGNPLSAGHRCGAKYLNADSLERRVWEDCRSFIRDPGAALEEARARLELEPTPPVVVEADIFLVLRTLEEKKREKDRILTLYRRGVISEDDVESQLAQVTREEARLSAMIQSAQAADELASASHARFADAHEVLAALRSRLDAIEQAGDLVAQQAIIQQLVSSVTVRTDGQGKGKSACATILYHLNSPAEWVTSSTARRTSRSIAPTPAR